MTLGIIGGLGPAATVYFLDLITRMTDASSDGEHLEILLHSIPSTPDRTAYILGKSPHSPLPRIIEAGQGLVGQGARVIASPCMTAHAFHSELQRNISVPILNGITLTAKALQTAGITRAGIMATDGTVQTGLFQRELCDHRIKAVLPSDRSQEAVMSLIYDDVKTGSPVDMNKFEKVKDELKENGAQCIILGCTELSLIKRDTDIGDGFADAMEILAWHSVTRCSKRARVPYSQLVTRFKEQQCN